MIASMNVMPENNKKSSIILLGMPGSGKTTLGRRLAEQCERPFVDTDHLIEVCEGRSLQSILDDEGYLELRSIEERILLSSDFDGSVVSTGGSAVYSDRGMQRIKTFGQCVYLNVPVSILRNRIHNFSVRGIAAPTSCSFDMIFSEREPLYRRYADCIVDIKEESVEQTLQRLMKNTLINNDAL